MNGIATQTVLAASAACDAQVASVDGWGILRLVFFAVLGLSPVIGILWAEKRHLRRMQQAMDREHDLEMGGLSDDPPDEAMLQALRACLQR